MHAPAGPTTKTTSTPTADDGEPMAAIGAVAHWYLSLRARLRRGRNPAAHEADDIQTRRSSGSASWSAFLLRVRFREVLVVLPAKLIALLMRPATEPATRNAGIEPTFAGTLVDGSDLDDYDEALQAPDGAPGYGENVHDIDEPSFLDGDGDPAARQAAAGTGGRVQTMRTRLQPGRRQSREAQPSLLGNDGFELPQLHLLAEPRRVVEDNSMSADALEQNARLLEGVLEDFGVKGEIINVRPGPVVTLYELEPAPGIKSSRVIGLADDIARSMSAIAARVAVVPGRNAIGIELPNLRRQTVYLRELLASKDYDSAKGSLTLVLGKTIGGEPVIADLAAHAASAGRRHHRLGQVGGDQHHDPVAPLPACVRTRCRLIMIDPKMLELSRL